MAQQIQLRRDTAANWASANPVLAEGEPGLDLDNQILKFGNGSDDWATLPGFSVDVSLTDEDILLTSTYTGNLNTATPPTTVAEALELIDGFTLGGDVSDLMDKIKTVETVAPAGTATGSGNIFLVQGDFTLPPASMFEGQIVFVGALGLTDPLTITANGSDLINFGPSYLFHPQGSLVLIAVDFSVIGFPVYGWVVLSGTGQQFDLPNWVGQNIDQGKVVKIGSSGGPEWMDDDGVDQVAVDNSIENYVNNSDLVHESQLDQAIDISYKRLISMYESYQNEWFQSTDARLRCGTTVEAFNSASSTGWEIINGGGTLPPTPDGIDIQIHMMMHRPYRDGEVDATGTLDSNNNWPTQQYQEILTQTKASATGGDLSELAIVHPDASYTSQEAGVPHWFWESTLTGDPGEGPGLFSYDPFGPIIGVPVWIRLTHDVGSQTVTFWRGVPHDFLDNGDATPDLGETAEVVNGIIWVPFDSRTDAQYASMDPNGVENWKIGIRARMDVAWIKAYHFGGAAILDIDEDVLNANIGAYSFTDNVGNTILDATQLNEIAVTGAVTYDHVHDDTDINLTGTYTGTLNTASPPTTLDEALAIIDDFVLSGSPDDTDVSLTGTYTGNLNTATPPATLDEALDVIDDFQFAVAPPKWSVSSNETVSQPGPYGTFATYMSTVGTAQWTAIYLPAGTYDTISVYFTVPGDLTYRMCIDSVGSNGRPDTLVLDCGTQSSAGAAGFRDIAINFTTTQDSWYWIRTICESKTSDATIVTLNGLSGNQYPPWLPLGSTSYNRGICGLYGPGHTTGANVEPEANSLFYANSVGVPRVWMTVA